MTTTTLINELSNFQQMPQSEKLIWLTEMLCKISMYARDTYEPGTDQVVKPVELRIFNELLHRVAVFARSVANNDDNRMPDQDLFALMASNFTRLNIEEAEILAI